MFNGIIKNTGKIIKIYKKNKNCTLYILSKMKFTMKEIGSSISCSGTCLTLEKFNRNLIKFFVSKETLSRTMFKYSKKGDVVTAYEDVPPVDTILGVEIFPVVHKKSGSVIYVGLEDLKQWKHG